MNPFFERYKELGEQPKMVKLPRTLRVNTLKITPAALEKRMAAKGMILKKVPFLKHGYEIVKSAFSPGASLEYLLGHYYLQEAAAQIPVELFTHIPDPEMVLDACAAPGGKTTQLCVFTNAPIIALDRDDKRLNSLNNNLERMGCPNVATFHIDAGDVDLLKQKFTHILIDAPCSGNFTTDTEWFNKRTVDMFKNRSKVQYKLLEKAIEMLKSGGELVYSTCSLEPEEDEMVVDKLLKTGLVEIEKITCPGDPGITSPLGVELDPRVKHARRLWPWKTGTQGFFVAKFRKC